MGLRKSSFGLMCRILRLEWEFYVDKFNALRAEFHTTTRIKDNEDFGLMDSDEAPYLFYARAWLSGYRYAKKQGEKVKGNDG